jgi:hypothetical protein
MKPDLHPQILWVRHTSSFPRIFGRISFQPKNRFGPKTEFFNRSDRSLPFAAFGAEQIESTGALRVEPGLRTE